MYTFHVEGAKPASRNCCRAASTGAMSSLPGGRGVGPAPKVVPELGGGMQRGMLQEKEIGGRLGLLKGWREAS